ncbi:TPA: hypothetical protein UL920_001103 [Stenotrophomonas maltophilia]|nr:hypothetical protein [Stenotrophomonas maltophilia]HEL7633176.1 hypothetical protein [Stenotrophomonas maltophilia]
MADSGADGEQTKKEAGNAGAKSPSHIASALTTMAGGILAVATLIGFFLHLSGDVAHSTYLTEMGVPAALFPQATDAKIIHGYYVVIIQGIRLISDIPWGIVLTMIGMSTLSIVIARAPVKENTAMRGWLERRSYWIRQPIVALLGSAVFLSAAASVGCFVLLLAIVPGLTGERFGKSKASETKSLIHRGEADDLCELWKDNQRLARGQVIAASSELISFYDIDLKAVRILELNNIEIRAPLKK